MTRALITGVTGQDGSYLAQQLLELGWEVHGILREPGHKPELAAGIATHVADLSHPPGIRQVVSSVSPDVIFNLGGISSVAQSWTDPEEAGRVSGLAVATLLESAWQLQERTGKEVRFVQASSSEIFGMPLMAPQTENTAIAPTNPYGAAKAFAHHLTAIYRSKGLFASSAILFNHESPRRPESFVTRKITLGAAQIALGKQDKLLLGNLDAKRDWGWAPDYVDALVKMARTEHAQDFVIATGEMHSVREFARVALIAAGVDDWSSHLASDQRFMRPTDAHETRGDPSLAWEVLGWKPTMAFGQIVEAMVRHDLAYVGSSNSDLY